MHVNRCVVGGQVSDWFLLLQLTLLKSRRQKDNLTWLGAALDTRWSQRNKFDRNFTCKKILQAGDTHKSGSRLSDWFLRG